MLKTLEDIQKCSADFARDRNWQEYQTPKNLSMALMVEAGELLEIFQWLTPEQSRSLTDTQQLAVSDELADILFYLVRVADELGINLCEAATRKAAINAEKYPPGKSTQLAD